LRELEAGAQVARLELELAQENVQVLQATLRRMPDQPADLERARLDEKENGWSCHWTATSDRQRAQFDLLNITGDLERLFR